MKLEFQNRWLRLVVELFPTRVPIRRYRVVPAPLGAEVERTLRQRITRDFRNRTVAGHSQSEIGA